MIAFSTSFRDDFDLVHFQLVLPKNLIHQMGSPSAIYSFLEAWKNAALKTITYKQYGLRQWFVEAAQQLSESGHQLDLRKRLLKSDILIWKYPPLEI